MDCSAFNESSENLARSILEKENVWINEGTVYGSAGENFIRINIACPRELLEKGLNRMADSLATLKTASHEE